jgi:L,D-transpeptidase ErfK/SrfK
MLGVSNLTKGLLGVALCAAGAGAVAADPAPREARLMPLHGEPATDLIEPGGTLLDVAFVHRLPFELVSRANPGIDPWIPPAGTIVALPTQLILPDSEPNGLVLNLPEMRLYDFTVEPMEIFAAAIGDMADPSLRGKFRIGAKRKNPDWHVPSSIRAEQPELPAVVPAGPDNPLGSRWMTIEKTSYGIHGTNVRWSIGRMATHGCIRLYEDEIQRLYDRTPTGTPLQILYQPVKWGLSNATIYVEVHPDLYGKHSDRLAEAIRVPRELGILSSIDLGKLWSAFDQMRGVPIAVGRLREPPHEGTTSLPTS